MGLRVESNGEIWHKLPGRDAYYTEGSLVFHYGEKGNETLYPGEPINNENLCLGIMANNNLTHDKLSLKPGDRQPIRISNPKSGDTIEFTYPGKSAMIITAPGCDEKLVGEFIEYFFKRIKDRRDHLHVMTVSQLVKAGWIPFYAPLQLKGIVPHARIVAMRTYLYGEDPTIEDLQALASILTKVDFSDKPQD